jgi:hypothetical protein
LVTNDDSVSRRRRGHADTQRRRTPARRTRPARVASHLREPDAWPEACRAASSAATSASNEKAAAVRCRRARARSATAPAPVAAARTTGAARRSWLLSRCARACDGATMAPESQGRLAGTPDAWLCGGGGADGPMTLAISVRQGRHGRWKR